MAVRPISVRINDSKTLNSYAMDYNYDTDTVNDSIYNTVNIVVTKSRLHDGGNGKQAGLEFLNGLKDYDQTTKGRKHELLGRN